ncbi:unnamed protein product, partial [Discosporangium mesarthrocarpum]
GKSRPTAPLHVFGLDLGDGGEKIPSQAITAIVESPGRNVLQLRGVSARENERAQPPNTIVLTAKPTGETERDRQYHHWLLSQLGISQPRPARGRVHGVREALDGSLLFSYVTGGEKEWTFQQPGSE